VCPQKKRFNLIGRSLYCTCISKERASMMCSNNARIFVLIGQRLSFKTLSKTKTRQETDIGFERVRRFFFKKRVVYGVGYIVLFSSLFFFFLTLLHVTLIVDMHTYIFTIITNYVCKAIILDKVKQINIGLILSKLRTKCEGAIHR